MTNNRELIWDLKTGVIEAAEIISFKIDRQSLSQYSKRYPVINGSRSPVVSSSIRLFPDPIPANLSTKIQEFFPSLISMESKNDAEKTFENYLCYREHAGLLTSYRITLKTEPLFEVASARTMQYVDPFLFTNCSLATLCGPSLDSLTDMEYEFTLNESFVDEESKSNFISYLSSLPDMSRLIDFIHSGLNQFTLYSCKGNITKASTRKLLSSFTYSKSLYDQPSLDWETGKEN